MTPKVYICDKGCNRPSLMDLQAEDRHCFRHNRPFVLEDGMDGKRILEKTLEGV